STESLRTFRALPRRHRLNLKNSIGRFSSAIANVICRGSSMKKVVNVQGWHFPTELPSTDNLDRSWKYADGGKRVILRTSARRSLLNMCSFLLFLVSILVFSTFSVMLVVLLQQLGASPSITGCSPTSP